MTHDPSVTPASNSLIKGSDPAPRDVAKTNLFFHEVDPADHVGQRVYCLRDGRQLSAVLDLEITSVNAETARVDITDLKVFDPKVQRFVDNSGTAYLESGEGYRYFPHDSEILPDLIDATSNRKILGPVTWTSGDWQYHQAHMRGDEWPGL